MRPPIFGLEVDAMRRNDQNSIAITDESDLSAVDYDLKATNQNAPDLSDKRTPAELMAIIEDAQKEIVQGLAALKA
jgi:hypothetical protein